MTDKAEEILNEMATLRREVDDDVDDLVAGAKEMTDWRYYVRNYPWVCVGGAVAIGYFAIPSRIEVMRSGSEEIETQPKRDQPVTKPSHQAATRGGVRGQLFNFASNLVMRSLIAYAGQNVTRLFTPEGEAKLTPSEDA